MFVLHCCLFGVLVLATRAGKLTVRDSHDPGRCSKSHHGELILVKDRENKDTILVCTEDNGVHNWKTTDNNKPAGEYFNPGYDCLDILNKNTKAKDGFYWVNFHRNKVIKVYCDMTTDGGGYMLIGHMNDTETWDVPSSNQTVEPFGAPQWSSQFGHVSVLDFRIQVASDENLKNTKIHWAFRFKNKRLLKSLMIVDQGGCPPNFPGVGDISNVKDLMTDEIVAKNFSCSIFGGYSHPIAKIGWTMMNSCLEKPCPNGFAYHPLFPVQVDFSGGFSFDSAGNPPGASSGATAFFGCDKGKCCACYGPPGGRGVYCLNKCQATNGGTVTKTASAWFWVRLNPPRKVWEKCMEYRSEDENGYSAWYKLVGDRNIPVKGRCGKGSEPLINDGVIVTEDGEAFHRVPSVIGLLAYRKDYQKLYVRMKQAWKVLAEEEKIKQVDQKLARMSARLDKAYGDMSTCTSVAEERPDLKTGLHFIGSLKAHVYCELPSGWTLVARFSNQDVKNWMRDAKFWYDRVSEYGETLNPSHNGDMISEAFWRLPANEMKITRSDDASHTALLETTNNCLKGKTFRQHMTSFGNFRKGAVWSSNKCLGSCSVKYGGQYQSTTGFEMHSCSSDIQSSNNIGFWCHWSADGAVLMIGGGGRGCTRADQGIGITEVSPGKFGTSLPFLDFGYSSVAGDSYDEKDVQKLYALNLWVR